MLVLGVVWVLGWFASAERVCWGGFGGLEAPAAEADDAGCYADEQGETG